MKVCILGDGLTSLALAKAFVNKGIVVDILSNNINKNKKDKIRTIGISKSNIEFLNKNILNIEKLLWDINKIDIYSESHINEKILSFDDNNQRLFSIVKNYKLKDYLLSNLNKNQLIKFKKKINFALIKKDYKLIVNCDPHNIITKKFFYKKISKNYYSNAYVTIINHKKIENNIATQIFTSKGPLAFLPISNNETSIVYSIRGMEKIDLLNLIKKYNKKYQILKIFNPKNFEIYSSNLRSYHHNNILAFGDLLHKLHPHAGQGFNMSLRDIKEILGLIDFRMKNGLELDSSICSDFEKKRRHTNYLFSQGVDFLYEFFKFESKINNYALNKTIKFLGKNQSIIKLAKKFADKGIIV
tara:strand:- start:281 stop:1351 length:1071 start_codon:yes stop_codon:yes gene_type:complete